MRKRNLRALEACALAIGLLLLARPAGADPRWWWNDIRVTNTPTDSITPHIASPSYATGNSGGNFVFITWAEVDPVGGDTEVWMTASFNAGCSFCAPIRVTDDDIDEYEPRIAVMAIPNGFWSIAVIFTDAHGQVTIAYDSTTFPTGLPVDQMCAAFEAVGPAMIAGNEYVRFGGIDAACSHADIASVGCPLFGHFHAVWEENGLAGNNIRYAHDLIGRGGPGWTMDPLKALPKSVVSADHVGEPRVSGDLATDPDPVSGNSTGDRSAVNVIFVETDPVGPTDRQSIVGLRSVDSGFTFSPTGARADAPAGAVSDSFVGQSVFARPALDAAYDELATTMAAPVAAAWDDFRQGNATPDVECDGRFLPTPAAPAPDWAMPDVQASSATDGRPTVALQYRFNATQFPEFVAWNDARSGTPEIESRGVTQDTAAAGYTDVTRFPFAPQRPQDSAVASDVQLSACACDPITLACNSTRAAGDARDSALDGNEVGFFVVWSDSRDGNREIYFKRTDQRVSINPPRLTTACDPAGGATIDVTFDIPTTCATGQREKMLRYLIYWGTNPGGPYQNAAAPIEILAASAPGPTYTQHLTGFLAGTTYQVIVVPEDEARNVLPASFDPNADGPSAFSNEASITTPSPCVAPTCLWRRDVTAYVPYTPPRAAVYLEPPSADDISLQGAAYQCPFADGDLEQDANALHNGVPLVLYQVNQPVSTLRLVRSGNTIQFHF